MAQTKVWLASLTGLGLAGGLLWSALASRPAQPGVAVSSATPSTAAPGTATLQSQPGVSADGASGAGALAEPSTAARSVKRQQADAVRAKLRQELAGRIRHSISAAASAGAAARAIASAPAAKAEPAPPARMPEPEGQGNQADRPLGKYIRETIQQQFIPLAGSCYEQLLQRQPQARGKLVLDLEIVGDGSVGGVVNDVSLGEGTTLDDEELATCVSESLYSTIFDAPPDDEKSVTVSYPLELEP